MFLPAIVQPAPEFDKAAEPLFRRQQKKVTCG
jgi:hypothetical protein